MNPPGLYVLAGGLLVSTAHVPRFRHVLQNYVFIISSGCFLGQWYPTCRELTVSKLKFEDPRMGRARHEQSLIDSELRS